MPDGGGIVVGGAQPHAGGRCRFGARRVKNMNKFERHVSIVSFVRSPRAHHTVLEFTPTPTRGGLEGREAHREFDASEDEHSESVSVGGSTDNTRKP